jgi:hypothetical protein
MSPIQASLNSRQDRGVPGAAASTGTERESRASQANTRALQETNRTSERHGGVPVIAGIPSTVIGTDLTTRIAQASARIHDEITRYSQQNHAKTGSELWSLVVLTYTNIWDESSNLHVLILVEAAAPELRARRAETTTRIMQLVSDYGALLEATDNELRSRVAQINATVIQELRVLSQPNLEATDNEQRSRPPQLATTTRQQISMLSPRHQRTGSPSTQVGRTAQRSLGGESTAVLQPPPPSTAPRMPGTQRSYNISQSATNGAPRSQAPSASRITTLSNPEQAGQRCPPYCRCLRCLARERGQPPPPTTPPRRCQNQGHLLLPMHQCNHADCVCSQGCQDASCRTCNPNRRPGI